MVHYVHSVKFSHISPSDYQQFLRYRIQLRKVLLSCRKQIQLDIQIEVFHLPNHTQPPCFSTRKLGILSAFPSFPLVITTSDFLEAEFPTGKLVNTTFRVQRNAAIDYTMLPPGNRRRAFHWRIYRRSAGDSCIANEPPENAQWNAPLVVPTLPNQMTSVFLESNSCPIRHSISTSPLLVLSASFNYDNYAASDVLWMTTLSLHSFMRSSRAEWIIAAVS